jgi:hypothetical protein
VCRSVDCVVAESCWLDSNIATDLGGNASEELPYAIQCRKYPEKRRIQTIVFVLRAGE